MKSEAGSKWSESLNNTMPVNPLLGKSEDPLMTTRITSRSSVLNLTISILWGCHCVFAGTPLPTLPPNPRPPISHLNAKNDPKPGTKPLDKLTACDLALNACQGVIKAQDDQIAQLKDSNQKLADELVKSKSPSILPTWAWILIGASAGVLITSTLHK